MGNVIPSQIVFCSKRLIHSLLDVRYIRQKNVNLVATGFGTYQVFALATTGCGQLWQCPACQNHLQPTTTKALPQWLKCETFYVFRVQLFNSEGLLISSMSIKILATRISRLDIQHLVWKSMLQGRSRMTEGSPLWKRRRLPGRVQMIRYAAHHQISSHDHHSSHTHPRPPAYYRWMPHPSEIYA